jgi:MFS family permease
MYDSEVLINSQDVDFLHGLITRKYNWVMALFAISIFLSAFLLFQIQPMIARYILPWFGGTPAVWSTVQMFFQVMLTGGYAYTNWLMGRFRRREVMHLVLLGVSLVVMIALGMIWKSPITPDASWKPQGVNSPIWAISKLLLISVGLPYFLLSTNSPLIQALFHRRFPERTAYRLYALSNTGSLIGLIAYPVLVEPNFTLAWQGRLWSISYGLYAILTIVNVVQSLRGTRQGNESVPKRDLAKSTRLRSRQYTLWILLAMAASILLLATTSQITQEVAVIPFLWVLPLMIYLFSFILAFSSERWYSRRVFLILLFLFTVLAGWAMGLSESLPILLQSGIYSGALFCACMVCHGEVYRLRPPADRLTIFYLMVSIGGALGGVLINFVAPYFFKGFWELPLGFIFTWLLLVVVSFKGRRPSSRKWVFILDSVLMISALLIACVRFGQQVNSDLTGFLYTGRNYYGVIRVKSLGEEGDPFQRYALVHGVTIHGIQMVGPEKRDTPTAYFGETGGGGLTLINHPVRGKGMRVGILGLGIGTMAAYGQPGDVYRFYEINPLIVDLAEGQGGYFSFLADSQAKVEIVLGDARLSLEKELAASGTENYDVLVLDVFSSDSIPVHLLDREAFELYLQHLKPDGLLAVHISNRHLDLVPVVWTLADYFDLERVVIDDPGDNSVVFQSLWMVLARNQTMQQNQAIISRAKFMENYSPHLRLWTDDYSNLFQILK